MPHIGRTLPELVKESSSPEESMSAITSDFGTKDEEKTPIQSGRDPPGSGTGTLFDRITGFEKAKASGQSPHSNSEESELSAFSPIDYLRTPQRDRCETTVLDVDNVVHSPKRHFLDCAITPIKRDKPRSSPVTAKTRLERSINTSNTLSLTDSERESHIADEYRKVTDPVTGKPYYYNRLTRVSTWRLPKGAVLKTKKTATNKSFATAVTTVTDESFLSNFHRGQQQGSENKDNIVSSPQTTVHSSVSQYSEGDVKEVETGVIKSPQDTTTTTSGQLFWCLYCGVKCGQLSMLESHLQQCTCFTRMQEPGMLSAQMELEKMLFSLWSTTGSNANRHVATTPGPLSETNASSSQDLFQSPYKGYNKENRSDQVRNAFSSSKLTVRERKSIHDICIEKKTCPFCEEALVGGDQFSSHLLICKERKRRRNIRRTPKAKEDPAVVSPRMRAGVRTPGRRMPWE